MKLVRPPSQWREPRNSAWGAAGVGKPGEDVALCNDASGVPPSRPASLRAGARRVWGAFVLVCRQRSRGQQAPPTREGVAVQPEGDVAGGHERLDEVLARLEVGHQHGPSNGGDLGDSNLRRGWQRGRRAQAEVWIAAGLGRGKAPLGCVRPVAEEEGAGRRQGTQRRAQGVGARSRLTYAWPLHLSCASSGRFSCRNAFSTACSRIGQRGEEFQGAEQREGGGLGAVGARAQTTPPHTTAQSCVARKVARTPSLPRVPPRRKSSIKRRFCSTTSSSGMPAARAFG